MAGYVDRIDTNEFQDAITKFEMVVSTFESVTETLDTKTTKLFDTWEGKGYKEFKSEYNKLKTAIIDETENLVTIKDNLNAIKESYEDWDVETSTVMKDNSVS